eukprot:496018-Pleurochrysis_carterae.AAC.3
MHLSNILFLTSDNALQTNAFTRDNIKLTLRQPALSGLPSFKLGGEPLRVHGFNLTLLSSGAETVLDGEMRSRILHVSGGASVQLHGLHLTRGSAQSTPATVLCAASALHIDLRSARLERCALSGVGCWRYTRRRELDTDCEWVQI